MLTIINNDFLQALSYLRVMYYRYGIIRGFHFNWGLTVGQTPNLRSPNLGFHAKWESHIIDGTCMWSLASHPSFPTNKAPVGVRSFSKTPAQESLRVMCFWLLLVGYFVLVVGCWLLVVGVLLLVVVGCWFAIGGWWLGAGCSLLDVSC